jgi:hypothetical protein
MLGKPFEVLSFQEGRVGVAAYLAAAGARPLRGYVPLIEGTTVERTGAACCAGHIERAEPDEDINSTVLALLLLEEEGVDLWHHRRRPKPAAAPARWSRHGRRAGGISDTARQDGLRVRERG